MINNIITTFADLANPRVKDPVDPYKFTELMRNWSTTGHKRFSQDNIVDRLFLTLSGNFHGVEMGTAKEILAAAMYDSDSLAQSLENYTTGCETKRKELEQKYSSFEYKKEKSSKIFWEKTRRFFSCFVEPKYGDDYFTPLCTGEYEKKQVETQTTCAAEYRKLAEVVREIREEYGSTNKTLHRIKKIIKKCEWEHDFTGEVNGTGIDVTFTDPKVRGYAERIVEIVDKIQHA